jgi:hypothetical protein
MSSLRAEWCRLLLDASQESYNSWRRGTWKTWDSTFTLHKNAPLNENPITPRQTNDKVFGVLNMEKVIQEVSNQSHE